MKTLQKLQAGHGHVQAGGCWGSVQRARGERKERGGRASHERLAPEALLSTVHIFEAEPETGCTLPFKRLMPQMDLYHQICRNTVGEAVLLRVRARALESDKLLAV